MTEQFGYLCTTDFQYEVGNNAKGNTVYPTQEDVIKNRRCAANCGITKVRVILNPTEGDCLYVEKDQLSGEFVVYGRLESPYHSIVDPQRLRLEFVQVMLEPTSEVAQAKESAQCLRDLFQRKAHSEDPQRQGVFETVIGNWRYWVTYNRNSGWDVEGIGPYYFDGVWAANAGIPRTDNPQDCNSFFMPSYWLEETSSLLLRLISEKLVAKVGDWNSTGEQE